MIVVLRPFPSSTAGTARTPVPFPKSAPEFSNQEDRDDFSSLSDSFLSRVVPNPSDTPFDEIKFSTPAAIDLFESPSQVMLNFNNTSCCFKLIATLIGGGVSCGCVVPILFLMLRSWSWRDLPH